LRTFLAELAAEENWARTDPNGCRLSATAEMATVPEKVRQPGAEPTGCLAWACLSAWLDARIAVTGESPSLSSTREAASAAFEARAADLEAELDYTVVPIQKLVRVQLGSALLAADYAAGRQEQRQAAE